MFSTGPASPRRIAGRGGKQRDNSSRRRPDGRLLPRPAERETAERNGQPIEAEVQVITLGDQIAWVGLPGEIFAEFGLAIKTASPFRYTIISTLANGAWGYFPNLKAFGEGNYEPVSARTAPGSGEKLVQTATTLLVESYKTLRAKSRTSD